jgi:hypothetical protein
VPAVAAALAALQPQRDHTALLKQQWRQLLSWLTRYIATSTSTTANTVDTPSSSSNNSGTSVPVQPQVGAVGGSQLFGLSTSPSAATGAITTVSASTASSTTTLLMWARDCTLHRVPPGRMDQPGRMDEVLLQVIELGFSIC